MKISFWKTIASGRNGIKYSKGNKTEIEFIIESAPQHQQSNIRITTTKMRNKQKKRVRSNA